MYRPKYKGQIKAHRTVGQSLVEFSLILPILLFITLGIIDFGRTLFMFATASGSIRDATRQATLVGTEPISGDPRYRACNSIGTLAGDFFFSNADAADSAIQSMDILYFDTTDNIETPLTQTLATIAANLEALDPDNLATVYTADYWCNDGSNIGQWADSNRVGAGDPDYINSDVMSNGDLIVILMDVEIDFITPFLADLFQSVSVVFRSQRTIVTELQLLTVADDRDGDGLSDQWEFQRFGCVLDGTQNSNNPIFLLPDGALVMEVDDSPGYAYIENAGYTVPVPYTPPTPADPPPGTITVSGYSIFAGDDCARESISTAVLNNDDTLAEYAAGYDCEPLDPAGDGSFYQNCRIFATDLFNALDDPDGDNCVNGCEESNGTNPIELDDSYEPRDTDNDGLSDAAELGLGTDPTVRDSDGDGILDGEEVCEDVNRNGTDDPSDDVCESLPTLVTPTDDPIYYNNDIIRNTLTDDERWTKTNPLNPDSDGDGLGDLQEADDLNPGGGISDPTKPDTDGDGIDDGDEVNGFVINLTVDGISFSITIGAGQLNPSGVDTDGDGIEDGAERLGHVVSYDPNGLGGTPQNFTVITNPVDADTDNDGLCDGPGTGGNTNFGIPGVSVQCSGIADINPIDTDTDDDSLTDYQELTPQDLAPTNPNVPVSYGTEADNIYSDADQDPNKVDNNGDPDVLCYDFNGNLVNSISDTEEIIGSLALAAGADPDADGINNAVDWDSDGDGLSDCDEVYIYDTNPYNNNTDGDGILDGDEVLPANFCFDPRITNTDGIGDNDGEGADLTCAGGGDDTDGDGVPDAWELIYYSSIADAGATDDTETGPWGPDNCNLVCEYNRGTNPTIVDTDGDGVRDGYEIGTIATDADSDDDGLIDGREGATTDINGNVTACVDDLYNRTGSGLGTTINTGAATDCIATDPRLPDTDFDGLDDGDEVNANWAPYRSVTPAFYNNVDATATDPTKADTDGDGLTDGFEIIGYNITTFAVTGNPYPFEIELVGDSGATATYGIDAPYTLANVVRSTNPNSRDTDGDGLTDFNEVYIDILDPIDQDTDNDGIKDGSFWDGTDFVHLGELTSDTAGAQNTSYGTGAKDVDSDNDGLTDGFEITSSFSYNFTYTDVNLATVNTNVTVNPYYPTVVTINGTTYAGFNSANPTMLNPTDADTDGDSFSDLIELPDANVNVAISPLNSTASDGTTTDVFDPDSDGDALADGLDPFPLVFDANTNLPGIVMVYSPSTVNEGETTTLTYTLSNGTSAALNNAQFTHALPVTNAAELTFETFSVGGTCVSDFGAQFTFNTTTASDDTLAVTEVDFPNAGDSCTLFVTVNANVPGTYGSTTTVISALEASSQLGASATLTVSIAPPEITQDFGVATIPAGGSATHTFIISNPSSSALSGASFTNTIDSTGLNQISYDTVAGLGGDCTVSSPSFGNSTGGTNNVVTVSGISVAAGGSCTVTLTVNAFVGDGGPFNSISTVVSGTSAVGPVTGVDNSSTSVFVGEIPPTIEQAFEGQYVGDNDPVNLTFTITNNDAGALTGVTFSNTLDTGLTFSSTTPVVNTSCGTPNATLSNADATITITDISIPGDTDCILTYIVDSSNVLGTLDSVSSAVSSDQVIGSDSSSASIIVLDTLPPSIVFTTPDPAEVQNGATETLTIEVTNEDTQAIDNVAFIVKSDSANLNFDPTGSVGGDCAMSAALSSAPNTNDTLTLSASASIASGATCTVTYPIQVSAMGSYTLTLDTITLFVTNESVPGSEVFAITGTDGDTDNDGLLDVDETDPSCINDTDCDNDGVWDGFELFPVNPGANLNQTDGFVLINAQALGVHCPWLQNNGTVGNVLNPQNADVDSDGFNDGFECRDSTDDGGDNLYRTLNPRVSNAALLTTLNGDLSATLQTAALQAANGNTSNTGWANANTTLSGQTFDPEGRVLVQFERNNAALISDNVGPQALDIATICGPTSLAASNVDYECAYWPPVEGTTEPANNNGPDRTVTLYIAPSAIFDLAYELGGSDSRGDIIRSGGDIVLP